MSNLRINIRIFLWHLQLNYNWSMKISYNSSHKGFKHGIFEVYEWKPFRK